MSNIRHPIIESGIAQHIIKMVNFVIKAPNLADTLIDILGTKLDIGPSQTTNHSKR